MIYFAIVSLFLCIILMLLGVLKGKNLPERIMSLCCLTNYIIVLICFFSLFPGKESYIDIAYIYGLFGFAVNLSLLKIFNGNIND